MKPRAPDAEAAFARVEWLGPFAWGEAGLVGGILDPLASTKHLHELLGKSGVYMILGDHPVHGERALLYIGETEHFSRRFEQHAEWVASEWRVGVYLGVVDPPALRCQVEQLLIYAHSPAYNARSKVGCGNLGLMRLWNTGRFHRLLPEVSSLHPWYSRAGYE